MPITVKFDPTANSLQAQIIPNVSLLNDGVLGKDQFAALSKGGSVGSNFVFRPGAVAPLASNVFNDWATLMVACNQQQGLRTIEFDDSIVSPCVVPAGTWNMSGVAWSGTLKDFNPSVAVSVSEGAVFLELRNITGALAVTFTGATPPVNDFIAGEEAVLFLQGASSVQCTGTGPFIRNSTPGSVAAIAVYQYGQLVTGSTPAFDVVAGAIGILAAFNVGNIQPNSVSGAVGAQLIRVILASSALIDANQPAFLGITSDSNLSLQRLTPSDNVVTSGVHLANINELSRCDLSTGNITVNLPAAFNSRGMWVVVKNIDPNPEIFNITIAPTGGDTVDGGASIVFNTPKGVVRLVSDGISDWIVI